MNLRPRRTAAAAALVLAAGGALASAPAEGVTGVIAYKCVITGKYAFTFQFNQDTNAPAKAYVGTSGKPTYAAVTSFPDFGVGIARAFGVKTFDGALDATVLINGKPVVVHAPIKKTSVPPAGKPLILTARGPLPKLTRAKPTKVVYKPSNILFTVNAYKADGSKLFGLKKGKCTMAAAGKKRTIDTVTFVKRPARLEQQAY